MPNEQNTTTELPTATPLVVKSLAQRLADKAAANAPKDKANKLILEFDQDADRLEWSCDKGKLLDLVKSSASGDSEGLMIALTCQFTFEVDGKIYKFDLSHPRGGGAWAMVKMIL